MTEFMINVATRIVAVKAMFESTRKYCAGNLYCGKAQLALEISPADIEQEWEKSAREDELEGLPVRKYSNAYLETIALQRKIVEEFFAYDTLLFHGSVVAVDGQAYLFTAKSGTGKSTHTRLWREMLGDRAVMVNDDKPFLEIKPEGVIVHGSPWNGKHRLGANISVPLKAICLLERGEENEIESIAPKDAVLMLMQQSCRPMDKRKMPKYLELLDGLSKKVDFYRLKCNMEPEAAKLAYEAMSGKNL